MHLFAFGKNSGGLIGNYPTIDNRVKVETPISSYHYSPSFSPLGASPGLAALIQLNQIQTSSFTAATTRVMSSSWEQSLPKAKISSRMRQRFAPVCSHGKIAAEFRAAPVPTTRGSGFPIQ